MRPATRGHVLGALAACSALLAGACSQSRGGAPAQPMRLEVVEGTASIVADSGTRTVDRSDKIAVGERIVLSEGGIAELTLADGVALELSGAGLTVDSGRKVTLGRGKVLVMTEGPVAVTSGPVTVRSGRGTFRVDRGASTRVAVYKDEARINGPATLLPVPTYHESVVAAGAVPPAADALRIDPSDRWDIRFLKDAIDIDARLANLSRGLEAQLGSGTGIDFYRRVLPAGFQVNLLAPMAGDRKTDVLIGSLIAHEAAAGGADETKVLADVFAMWREGASWGLIAHRFGVAQSALFSRLLDSVNRANLIDQGRGPALASPRRPSPTPSLTRSGHAPPPQQPTASPQPSSQPSPSPDVLKPVTDLLDQVVQDLLGGLLRPSPKP